MRQYPPSEVKYKLCLCPAAMDFHIVVNHLVGNLSDGVCIHRRVIRLRTDGDSCSSRKLLFQLDCQFKNPVPDRGLQFHECSNTNGRGDAVTRIIFILLTLEQKDKIRGFDGQPSALNLAGSDEIIDCSNTLSLLLNDPSFTSMSLNQVRGNGGGFLIPDPNGPLKVPV